MEEPSNALFTATANKTIIVELIKMLSQKGVLSIDEFSDKLQNISENLEEEAVSDDDKTLASFIHKFTEELR